MNKKTVFSDAKLYNKKIFIELNKDFGFDMHGKTAGVAGASKIGRCLISMFGRYLMVLV